MLYSWPWEHTLIVECGSHLIIASALFISSRYDNNDNFIRIQGGGGAGDIIIVTLNRFPIWKVRYLETLVEYAAEL